MANNLSRYLDSFKACFNIDSAIKGSVAQELYTHLEDKRRELKENGLSEEEAGEIATQALGPPELIAQQIYEVHAQGSWQEAFLAASPHLLAALLIASYYWQNMLCLSVTLAMTAGIAIYGWHQNKSIWLFPWLGYYLLPVILAGLLLISLPQSWAWVVAFIYIPLALFVFVYIVKQTADRDRLYVSLMLAPLLMIFSWLLTLNSKGGFLAGDVQLAQVQANVPWAVTSFLVLAATTIVFIRVRQRWCKATALLIPPIVILTSVAWLSGGAIGFWACLILILCLFAIVSPVWLQLKS